MGRWRRWLPWNKHQGPCRGLAHLKVQQILVCVRWPQSSHIAITQKFAVLEILKIKKSLWKKLLGAISILDYYRKVKKYLEFEMYWL